METTYVIAYPFGGRPVPVDWHLAVRSLLLPANSRIVELYRRSYLKDDGKMSIPLEVAQTELIESAIKRGGKYILFVEDDTIPPPAVLLELGRVLENADPSVMVCGGVYTTRTHPPEPIVYKGPMEGCTWDWKLGDIFPCWAVGMGCTMIKLELFQKMPKPWFKRLTTLEEVRQFPELFPEAEEPAIGKKIGCGEDMFFYTKLAKMGYKVLAHGGVLPVHWDITENIGFWLPKGSPPVKGVKINGKDFGWTDPNVKVEEEVLCEA